MISKAGRILNRYPKGPCSLLVLALLIMAGCGGGASLESFVPTEETLRKRVLTTRQFDGISEADLLSASAGVLQDLGFSIEEIETSLGLISGTKIAESKLPGVTWFVNLPGFKRGDGPKEFRASVVVRQGNDTTDKTQYVRVTFHQKVWAKDVPDDDEDSPFVQAFIQESIDDPELYGEFFELLSKSVFLEGQKL